MHSLFHTDDILHAICDTLLEEDELEPLARLTYVSKTFFRIAAGNLWRNLDDFKPIFAIFEVQCPPSDPAESNAELVLGDRTMQRLMFYCSFVRCISIDCDEVPEGFLKLMTLYHPILPNLHSLTWLVSSPEQLECIMPFILPSLTRLTLTGDVEVICDEHGLWTEYLHRICTEAPHLRNLELSWMHSLVAPCSEIQHKTASVLPAFTHLTTLALAWNVACAPSIILALSTLPRLKNLTIDRFHTSVGANEVLLMLPTDGFESLESLKLQLPFQAAYQALLASSAAKLKNITLYMQYTYWRTLEPLDIICFVVHTFGRSLERFHFRAPDYPFMVMTLLLLQIIDLIDVELGWIDPRDITDALCESMARAWPRLERLKFLPRFPVLSPPSTMMTLAGLLPFAAHCPKLRCLHIVVNATGQNWPFAESIPAPSYRLHRLDLSGSLVDCPYAVADFLLRVFLDVENMWFDIVMRGYQNDAFMKAWKEVRHALTQDNTPDI